MCFFLINYIDSLNYFRGISAEPEWRHNIVVVLSIFYHVNYLKLPDKRS